VHYDKEVGSKFIVVCLLLFLKFYIAQKITTISYLTINYHCTRETLCHLQYCICKCRDFECIIRLKCHFEICHFADLFAVRYARLRDNNVLYTLSIVGENVKCESN